jgi:N6-adenosine-specific RNA methylase IME4
VVGTSLDQGDELDALAKLPEERQTNLIARAAAGEKISAKPEAKRAVRAKREQKLAEQIVASSEQIGKQLYGVIYADPPWRFEPYSRDTGMDRAADNHYPTMELDAIKAIQIPAADDCVLFLWATAPMLPQAIEVMHAWGFDYKSHCVWLKDRLGTGYWFRNKHELLLVGTRGNIPAPAQGQQYASVIAARVDDHSAKPNHFAEIIEELFPNLPAIELFARVPRLGWEVWGNEVAS